MRRASRALEPVMRPLLENGWRLLAEAPSAVRQSVPILYFGERRGYLASETRVITVGLNPSKWEFPQEDAFKRFPAAKPPSPGERPSVTCHVAALDDYFRVEPYTAWFKAYDHVLQGLDASYYDGRLNVALHTDLCSPIATDPTWTGLGREERKALAAGGMELWHRLVKMLQPDVILASIAKSHLSRIWFPSIGAPITIHTVRQANPYHVQAFRVQLPRKQALLVYGKASQLPFGTLSRDDKTEVGAAIAREIGANRTKLCFVQFMHPGKEHRPDEGTLKSWNRGPHRRKFMKVIGRCMRSERIVNAPLVFWGEWEAQSEVVREIYKPARFGPRFIYRPFFQRPLSCHGLQNTDPFVFGGRFFYTGCQQWTVKGPTQLRFLQRGSVILFGSCVGERSFALDTVFVVAEWVDHDRSNYRDRVMERVSTAYEEVTLLPWYAAGDKGCQQPRHSYRLYFGATHKDPVDGMFSFFPCAPAAEQPRGFARPVIRLPGIVTGRLKQGKRLNPLTETREARQLWKSVVDQVKDQGLWMALSAKMPERQSGPT